MINKCISQAIKASNWIAIEYENTDVEITKYWIAIQDIDIKDKSFFVHAFNFSKINNESKGLINIKIKFERIKTAYQVENTTYEQSNELIPKIYRYITELDWLGYDSYNDETLDYIFECIKHEEVAFQHETTLVRGIDQSVLEQIPLNQKYSLSYEQMAELIPKLERLSKNEKKFNVEEVTLALNLLSIVTEKGMFVVAYKQLYFNPIEQSLILDKDVLFNYDFASNEMSDFRHNLRYYLDIETDRFTELFISNPHEAKEMLMNETKRFRETLDDKPYIFELRRTYLIHLEKEINAIKNNKVNNQLSIPLEAFFGNMSKDKLKRKRNVDVVVLDNKVNIDQMRVIYNSLVQPITYVQGPPGTGKTATIINVLISAFFNQQTVLVSSNNNKPISDILTKLQTLKSKDSPIPLPFIRLGNSDKVLESLNYLRDILPRYKKLKSDDQKLDAHAISKKEKTKSVNEILERYEMIIDLEEEIDALKALNDKLTDNLRGIAVQALLDEKQKQLSNFKPVDDADIEPLLTKADQNFLSWLFFTSIKHLNRIYEPKNQKLFDIINSTNDEEKVREFNKYTSNEDNMKNLLRIFPIILTTNQSSFRLGPSQSLFDLVVLDEAGQCSIGHSLFTIARGNRLLLVGDQNQLKPVVTIAPETNKVLVNRFKIAPSYDYLSNSILLTMQQQDTISKFVLLRYHYRSRKDIIEFSNKKYYKGQLKVQTPEDLIINSALQIINVDSQKEKKPQIRNVSFEETHAIIQSLKHEKSASIGIITPFKNQEHLIKDALLEEGYQNIVVGTVHVLQGDEKDVIYLSTGITPHTLDKTFDWVKNNQELLNVATTRAKKKLVLVTDVNEIEKRSKIKNDLSELVEYVQKNGKHVELKESTTTRFINGSNFKNYNSKKEEEFIETINHILTLGSKLILKQKVRIASILDQFTSPKKYDYGLKAEFDLVVFKQMGSTQFPVLIIELDGEEHYNNLQVQTRDKIKEEICKDNQIKILRIHNDYSRRYMYIKDILLDILK